MNTRTAALILAAGAGERFGGVKPAARWRGVPLVAHVVAAAHAAGLDEVVVVTGHEAPTVAAAVPRSPTVRVVRNPRYRTGQASSVRRGLETIAKVPGIAQAVVLVADQPTIDPEVIARVVTAAMNLQDGTLQGAMVVDGVRARYTDGAGHPVLFPRRTWPRLRQDLTGDEGARQLAARLHWLEVPVAGPRPRDVDRPEDLVLLPRPR